MSLYRNVPDFILRYFRVLETLNALGTWSSLRRHIQIKQRTGF